MKSSPLYLKESDKIQELIPLSFGLPSSFCIALERRRMVVGGLSC